MKARVLGGVVICGKRFSFFLMVLSLLIPSVATSSDMDMGADMDGMFDLGIEADLALLYAEEPEIVGATFRRQRIGASPSSVTLISRSQIKAAGVTSLHDILRLVPGFDVHVLTRSWAILGARAATTSGSNLLVVLIDGRELAFEGVGVPYTATIPISLEEIEQIEVIKGPGSALYGPNAFQAVVNIITRSPSDMVSDGPTAGATLWGGTYGTYYGQAWAAATLGEWDVVTSGGHDRSEPFAAGPLPHRVYRGRVRASRSLYDDLSLVMEAGASNMVGSAYAALGMWDFERHYSAYTSAELEFGNLTVQTWINRYEWENNTDPGLALSETAVVGGFGFPEGDEVTKIDSTAFDAAARYSLEGALAGNVRHRLIAGLGLRRTNTVVNFFLNCPEPFISADDCTQPGLLEEWRGSAFLHDDVFLADEFTLTLGVRADWNSVMNEAWSISPRVAGVWHVYEGHDIRLGYGRAFRKPSQLEAQSNISIELYPPFDRIPAFGGLREVFAEHMGNAALKTEKIDAVELGWRARLFGGRLNMVAEGWGYRLFDFVRFDNALFDDPAYVGFVTLETPTFAYGGELAVDGRIFPWLSTGLSYAHRKTIQEEGDSMSNRAHSDLHLQPNHQVDYWTDLGRSVGPRVWMHAQWRSAYKSRIADPISALNPTINQTHGARTRITMAISYRLNYAGTNIELGFSGQDLTAGIESLGGRNRREFAGCPASEVCPDLDWNYAGQPLDRLLMGFLRADF